MRYGILGGGFGLYGYLPAIAGLGPQSITTLEAYRPTIRRRPELAQFESHLNFVANPPAVLENSDVLVIARRPVDQERLVQELPLARWQGRLVLEKPLAPTPARARSLQQSLDKLGVPFVEGFSILETDWAAELVELFRKNQTASLTFNWRFMAHHYQHDLNNWKRRVEEGGGALRFYAIHLIALLARLAEWKPRRCSALLSPDEDPVLDCLFQSGASHATVHCNTQWRGDPAFELSVRNGDQVLMHRHLANPFVMTEPAGPASGVAQDSRVFFLQRLLLRVSQPSAPGAQSSDYLKLWAELEQLRATAGPQH